MPAKLTRKKTQKEARRAARREATNNACEVAKLQNSSAIVIQLFCRFMFLQMPHMIYSRLQYMLFNRRHIDVGFAHISSPRIEKVSFEERYGAGTLGKDGWIFFVTKAQEPYYQARLQKNRNVISLTWGLRISPYAPIKISSMLLQFDPLIDNHTPLRPHKDWVLYVQAADHFLKTGVSFPAASIGRETIHFYGEKRALHFLTPMLPVMD